MNLWWSERGFTASLRDCYPKDESFREEIAKEYAKARLAIQGYGISLSDPLAEAKREEHIIGHLNKVRDIAYNIVNQNLSPNNAFRVMEMSGSKGSKSNIGQMIGMGGLQEVRGRRIQLGARNRCLPYFTSNDLDPRAQGMCPNSLVSGMTPAEYFFHITKSREGIMNTAMKTADVGYAHTKIVKAIGEDIITHTDLSVRNGINKIFQSTYGNDGLSATELERVIVGGREIMSFINLKREADRINSSYQYFGINQVEMITKAEEEQKIENDAIFEDEGDPMFQGEYDFNFD